MDGDYTLGSCSSVSRTSLRPHDLVPERAGDPFLLLCEQDFVEACSTAGPSPQARRFLLLCEQDFVEAPTRCRSPGR